MNESLNTQPSNLEAAIRDVHHVLSWPFMLGALVIALLAFALVFTKGRERAGEA